MTFLWLERPMPEEHQALLAGRVQLLPSATTDPEHPLRDIAQAEAIIASSRIRYGDELFGQAPKLKVICRTGIGYDNIDVAAATARGIAVCNVPDGPTISTAEHAFALILAVAKNLKPSMDALVHGVQGDFFSMFTGLELDGAYLGIIGFGRIGRRVADIAHGFGMRVLVHDPFLDAAAHAPSNVRIMDSLDELLSASDVVSLHLPLSASTRNLIDRNRLPKMKHGAILVNTSRGGIVDEAALWDALEHGQLFGAGLDVFAVEPPSLDHPLLQRADVIATPHIAAATSAGKARLWQGAIRQALMVLDGERPPHLVNPDVWKSA